MSRTRFLRWYELALLRLPWRWAQEKGMVLALKRVWRGARVKL